MKIRMPSIEEEFLERCKQNNEPLNKPEKVKLTLSIREDIIEDIKKIDINISDLVERLLIHIINKERDNDKTRGGQ